jgi:hypothetical protein
VLVIATSQNAENSTAEMAPRSNTAGLALAAYSPRFTNGDLMRFFPLLAACALLAGCESFSTKLDASRQDRCQRADWALVGERDGVEGATTMAERYERICGDMFQPEPYRQGLQKGTARRPRPSV